MRNIIFLIFFKNLKLIENLVQKCIEWSDIYNIGDKYIEKGNDVCMICTCTRDWVNP